MNNMTRREVDAKLRELGIHVHDDYCNFDRDDDVLEDWIIEGDKI
jgi:hypothetical protein